MNFEFRHLCCLPLAVSLVAGIQAAREVKSLQIAAPAVAATEAAPAMKATAAVTAAAPAIPVTSFATYPVAPAAPYIQAPRLLATEPRIATRLNQIRPCVKQRLLTALKNLPANYTILITSAHRTTEEQANLVSDFGVKARPGTSTHEDGRAVDLNLFIDGERVRPKYQNRYIGKAMAAAGFRHLGAIDPVHYSVPKELVTETAADVNFNVMIFDQWLALRDAGALQNSRQASAEGLTVTR